MSTTTPRPEFVADLEERLTEIRTDTRLNAMAIVAAVLLGLVAAAIHWFGLVVAGMLIGLVSRSIPFAILGALGFGVVVLVVFAVTLGSSAVAVPGMAPIVYVAVGSAFALPVLGSLLRGVV